MSNTYDSSDKDRSIADILASKGSPRPLFTEAERKILASEHGSYIDKLWEQKREARLLELKPRFELFQAAAKDESFQRVLHSLLPGKDLHTLEKFDSPTAEQVAQSDAKSSLCDVYLISPPYSDGGPLEEVVGADVTTLSGQSIDLLKTSSALALPNEGAISIGVGNGKFDIGNEEFLSHTLHPFSIESGGNSLFESDGNRASASIEYLAVLPGDAPFPARPKRATTTRVTVTIDVGIGDPSRPFFYTLPPQLPVWGSDVQGYIFLTLYRAGSPEPQTRGRTFLSYVQGPNGSWGNSNPPRNFSLSATMFLPAGTASVLAVVDVRVGAYRWHAGANPEDRNGFALIDLRSPNHDTKRIHYIMEAGGPIRIPRIGVTLCPEPEVRLG